MKAIEFLQKRGINFYWIYYYINEEGKKKFVSINDGYIYPDGNRDPTHFKINPYIIEKQMSYFLNNRNHIYEIADENDWQVGLMIDTFTTRQIDVDNEDFVEEFESLKNKLPYYNSVRKGLPHFFFRADYDFDCDGSTPYEYKSFDILHGTCGLISPDTTIFNHENDFDFNFKNFIIDYIPDIECKKRAIKQKKNGITETVFTDKSELKEILGVIELLDDSRATPYQSWINIAIAIKHWDSGSDGYKAFKEFSKKSKSFNNDDWGHGCECDTIWEKLKPDGRKTIGTLYYYARKDNFVLYNKRFGETYERVKKKFEKNIFKVKHPICYVELVHNNPLVDKIERPECELKQVYRNLYCYFQSKKKKEDEDSDDDDEVQYKRKPFLKSWLDDSNIRCFDFMNFVPHPHYYVKDEKYFNLFRGFDIFKRCTNFQYDKVKGEYGLKLFQDHIHHILSGKDQTDNVYNYIVNWIAKLIQKPQHKIGVAIVMKSKQGAGKNTVWDYISNCILGYRYCLTTAEPNDVFSEFNDPLENKLLVTYDEASGTDTFQNDSKLKDKITGDTIEINSKRIRKKPCPNYLNWIFLSNSLTPIKKEQGDRRFMCIRCSDDRCNDNEYFKQLNQLTDRLNKYANPCLHTLWAFYSWIMSIDISNFDAINDRPNTEYNKNMTYIDPVLLFLYEHVLGEDDKLVHQIKSSDLYNHYTAWYKENKQGTTCDSKINFCRKKLKEFAFLTFNEGRSRYIYVSYNLDDLLKHHPELQETGYDIIDDPES